MKTAIKVFSIINIIEYVFSTIAILFLTILINLFDKNLQTINKAVLTIIFVIAALSMLISIIISIIGIRCVNRATKKADLIAIGVVTLLFSNLISGILMLLIRDKDFVARDTSQNSQDTQSLDTQSLDTQSTTQI